MASPGTGEIINLNVGGQRFSTSRETLSWVPDSFFCSLLSGRIPSLKDETGAIFIDRDPTLFSIILNFLRTKEVSPSGASDIAALRHEAEFYGITSLAKRLRLCQDLDHSGCGDVLFHGFINTPPGVYEDGGLEPSRTAAPRTSPDPRLTHPSQIAESSLLLNRHSRHSSTDYRQIKTDLGFCIGMPSTFPDPAQVHIIQGHHNWIAVAYSRIVCCFKATETRGWNLIFTSPRTDEVVERIALNSKVLGANNEVKEKLLAISHGNFIRLWCIQDSGNHNSCEIGLFDMRVHVDALFFIGSQLVSTSSKGKVGVWHAMTQNFQIQDVAPITSFDTAGSFLLLGCVNGSIYYVDMQKFPLRMKDNDLLVTELYKDPNGDSITALSVYLTPKTSLSGNWIEIAYGTTAGTVRVIVQHPETVGSGPQLFQTFTVHQNPVTRVMLSEKHLVSVCSEYNHVRTWSVTRFRGMISTQPGSTPLTSFKIITLEDTDPFISYSAGNHYGPYGERDDAQVFIQKVVPETCQVFVRLSSNGQRICSIRSVDGSTITAFTVHEYEGTTRMSSRPRRFLFTGHSNGSIQIWDLTTAMEIFRSKNAIPSGDVPQSGSQVCSVGEMETLGGPTPQEVLKLLDECDLTYSCSPTPNVSPSPSLLVGLAPLQSALTSNGSLSRLKASSNLTLFCNSSLSLDGTARDGSSASSDFIRGSEGQL